MNSSLKTRIKHGRFYFSPRGILKKLQAKTFLEQEIFNNDLFIEKLGSKYIAGNCNYTIPKELPHSFHSNGFHVLWVLDIFVTKNGKEKLIGSFDLSIHPRGGK